jgi:hypothetical protein
MNEQETYEKQQRTQSEWTQWRRDGEQKSPFLAGLLSMMPGVGHIYVGYYRRAFTHFLIFAGTIFVLAESGGDFAPLLGPFVAFFWFYNLIDAVRRAHAYNRAVASGSFEAEVLPPDRGFGPTSGVILILIGAVLLGYTRFDYDLRWLRDWWPVALILLGANILWRHRRGAASE